MILPWRSRSEEIEIEARDLEAFAVEVLAIVSVFHRCRNREENIAGNCDLLPCKPSSFSLAPDLRPPPSGLFNGRRILCLLR